MKIIFSKSVAKFANWAQAISLFFFLVLFFSSCKKEILTDKKPDELVTAATGSSIKQISYTDFLQRVDLNKIGNIGKVFKISPKESLLKTDVMGNQDYQFEIETSQVMEVKLNGHISYVFPLKLSSKYARNFSNLTIDIKDGTVKTFINTYTPTDKWISDWKQKRVVGGFEGEVSYQVIPNSFDFLKPSTSTMSTNCFFWTETYLEPYPCQGSGDQRHMPWEYCPWAGQSNGPGYALTTRMKSVCISGGGGGDGGGDNGTGPIGGGGGTGDPITNPFPPSTYQPCGQPPSRSRPGVPPCEEPTLVEHLIYNLGITDATQINYLNSPLRRPLVEQLSDYLHVNVGSQGSLNFARWAVGYLMKNTQMSFGELGGKLINKPFNFEVSQEVYVPRDKEPTSYYWRPKLKRQEDFNEYLNFVPFNTDPKDLYNCHYHAFGDIPGSITYPGSPKHILAMNVKPYWEKVTGNIQVGDRIAYYVPNAEGTGPGWVHSGIVLEVDTDGYAIKIASKLGPYYEVIEHHPRDIPESYGSKEALFIVNGKTEPSRIYWRKK